MSAEASVRRLDLLPEDKAVIVASDGLWDVIGDQDVVTMVDQHIKVSDHIKACLVGGLACSCQLTPGSEAVHDAGSPTPVLCLLLS